MISLLSTLWQHVPADLSARSDVNCHRERSASRLFFNKLASVFPRRYTLKHGNDLCGAEGTPAFRLQNINNLYFLPSSLLSLGSRSQDPPLDFRLD